MWDSGIDEVTFSKQIPYSGMKNVPPYYFLKGPLIAKDILVCLTFLLKEVANQSCLKKDSPKFSDYIKKVVCSCRATYEFQSEATPYSCLNVKELVAQSRPEV